jgi:hypothetical protein
LKELNILVKELFIMKYYRLPIALTATLLVLLTSACGSQSATHEIKSTPRTLTRDNFHGEYGQLLYDLYINAKDDAEANLVADNDLSEQDMTDVENLYVKCMARLNVTVVFENHRETDKANDFPSDTSNDKEKDDELIEAMSKRTGQCINDTNFSSFQIAYNTIKDGAPGTTDETEFNNLRIACLKRKGFVSDTYTLDDYKYDWGSVDGKEHGLPEKYGDPDAKLPGFDEYWGCQNNPNK